MTSIAVELLAPSNRPRATFPQAKLKSLGLGNGKHALVCLIDSQGSSSSSSSASKNWLCLPAWQHSIDPGTSTSSAGTPRRLGANPKTEPEVPSPNLLIPSNLLPDVSTEARSSLHADIYPSSDGGAEEEVELGVESITSADQPLEPRRAVLDYSKHRLLRGVSNFARTALCLVAKELLIELGCVLPGQNFAVIHQGYRVVFRIQPNQPKPTTFEEAQAAKIRVLRDTNVVIAGTHAALSSAQMEEPISEKPKVQPSNALSKAEQPSSIRPSLGGLEEEMKQLHELVILPLTRPDLFEQHNIPLSKGVLLHGPPGTGKTSLSLAVASSFLKPSQIFTISGPELNSSYHGGTERRIRRVFQKARRQEKAVIIIDEIDVIAASRDGGDGDSVGSRVVATLLTEIDGLGQYHKKTKKGDDSGNDDDGDDDAPPSKPGRLVVIAATNRPNVLDPALRRPGRLDREIEIGVPNPTARLDIIKKMLHQTPHNMTEQDLQEVAARTHGFVGADLSALVREAGMRVIRRQLQAESRSGSGTGLDSVVDATRDLSLTDHTLTAQDVFAALPLLRPSSLRSLLPPPPLSWSSIGLGSPGSPYDRIKQSIQQTIEWPLRYQDRMRRLGISANRGVLLYGPPGCSKTMIARACAQSEGINWIGVKGPELYSKYLGDSEKAVRELFHKARAAAPTIIFFDEIDALTTTRSAGTGDDGGANAVSDRVIATLLTEMDGAEALEKVVIIAATNRPQVIDPALLRPGRLDTLLYVGPPDVSARRSILELRTSTMAVEPSLDLDRLAQLTEGCSGAEIVSVCQDAGIRAMSENIEATEVKQVHFEAAAQAVRRRITPEMVRQYESWRDQRALL